MHNDVNSRASMSRKNTFINDWIVSLRKNNNRVIGTVQFMNWIDKNLDTICELIILPRFINFYSDDKMQDTLSRIENKDFLTEWKIIDKIDGTTETVDINLYLTIDCYNTDFKPNKLVINHNDYLLNIMDKSERKFNQLVEKNEKLININKIDWKETFEKL